MQTSAPSVFAAGDVASFPVALFGGKSASIYHWQIAQAHGTRLSFELDFGYGPEGAQPSVANPTRVKRMAEQKPGLVEP